MNKTTVYFLFLLSCVFLVTGCLQIRLRNANENYEQFAYAEAAKDYEWVLTRRNIPEAMINVAESYRQMGNSVKTEYWYRKALKLPNANPVWKLYLGEALKKNGNYPEARKMFSEYLLLNRNDLRVIRLMESCDSISQFAADTSLYSISVMRFNTQGENNFSPAFYRGGIVFLSDKNFKGLSKTKSDFNGKRYLDLFYTKKTEKNNWLDPEPLRGEVNGLFNEGPATFTRDFNTMYFTRNNYVSNKVDKNKHNVNVLKIYKAELKEGLWKLKGEMLFNSGDYSVAHPALNSDGTFIYFSSDMPWGYGGTDIYRVKQQGPNVWTKPINIGINVNSEGNELFPFLPNDSTLYFSSNSFAGLGGLDIYVSHFKNGEWSPPLNLGTPVNSSADDFGFIIDSLGQGGFFSSDRFGGVDKIFSFVKNPPKLYAKFNITDKETKSSLEGIAVKVISSCNRDTTFSSDASGSFSLRVSPECDYTFYFNDNQYYFAVDSLTTKGKAISQNITMPVKLERIKLSTPLIWKGIDFKKKDWQLQVSSAPALDNLEKILEQNPQVNIEVCSYTDSRGSDAENLKLTQRRAELVQQYLASRGIKSNRVTARGYGEAKLLNKCTNNLLCLEEDHQVNNRIEIVVKSISKGSPAP